MFNTSFELPKFLNFYCNRNYMHAAGAFFSVAVMFCIQRKAITSLRASCVLCASESVQGLATIAVQAAMKRAGRVLAKGA